MKEKNNKVLSKHRTHASNVDMTKNILREYRDLKREETDLRRREWIDNFNKEQTRIQQFKQDVMFNEQSKQ